ncbi:efflux RND transporter permease subunit [Marinobacterium jannaschii]|uniref:efflux RND transporter permease subunit n=1 Tax=Marinobacterium jannaschii TaxID=64970 RepID=UPI00056D4D12|nr:efflux RND transporter permease subunit [Marinobacterium jannaschii]
MTKPQSVGSRPGWVAWFASNPVAANLLMLVVLVCGVMSGLNLRVESFPALPPNSISVEVSYNSGSAAASEQAIAIKLEEALQGVEGIKRIYSNSHGGGVYLSVDRSSGYDLERLSTDIKDRIDSITSLPERAERPVISRETWLEDAITVQLYGDMPIDVLQESARRLRRQLLTNPAIEKINTQGRRTPEINIELDEAALQAHNLSLSQVAEQINRSSLIESGGELFSESGSLIVKADQQRRHLREFTEIPLITTPQGQKIRLADLAQVDDGYSDTPVLSRYNGQPSIGLEVKMYASSDILAIAEQVQREVERFRPQLPQGISLVIWNDQSSYIADRLSLLGENALIGVALVLIMLALFLNLRVALWVACGLPVIFAGALLLMDDALFGLSLNELTTFGFIIALGIVVDDAVVVGESIHSVQQQKGVNLAAAIEGAERVKVPTVFGVLTTIVAFMALTLVEGEMGKIFSFFAYAAAFCLFWSLVESKLILPAHLAHPYQRGAGNMLSRGWGRLQQHFAAALQAFNQHCYRPGLQCLLSYRYAVVALMLALLLLVVGMVPSGQIRAVFFPDIPSDYIRVKLQMEKDAGYGLTFRQTAHIEQQALALNRQLMAEFELSQPPFRHIQTLVESAEKGQVTVELSPRAERPLSTDQISARWYQMIGAIEASRKLQLITTWQGAADMNIELRSESDNTLRLAGREVLARLQQIEGVSALRNSYSAGQYQLDLQLKPAAEALGLSVSDIASQIQQAYQGIEVQRFIRGKDEIKVRLRYPPQYRSSQGSLQQTYIRSNDGQLLPLNSVASVSSRYVAAEIDRINGSRVAEISADVDKSVIGPGEILQQLEAEFFPQLKAQYPGLELHLGGEAQEEAETTASLQRAFILALLAIYALLAIPLKSYFQPLLIMSAIPFGIVGALLGHWLHDLPLSILSLFGILALSGVVVNDSLLLISRYNSLRAHYPCQQAMVLAATSRLRAVLLTSVTTYIGLAPLLLETAENAQFLIPAAVAMGYGILFATAITLVLIPALVVISHDLNPANWRRKQAQAETVLENS